MALSEPESLCIAFGGSEEEGPATCVSPGCYRLGWTPWTADVGEIELYYGDVIEAELTADGSYRFVRVAERGPFEHKGWVVGPAFLESAYFDAFAAALEGAGGRWEVPMSGWLLTHAPVGSSFDVDEQLFRERARAYQAGVVDAPTTSE